MHQENKGIRELETLVKSLKASGKPANMDIPIVFGALVPFLYSKSSCEKRIDQIVPCEVSGFAGWIAPIFDVFNYFGGFQNIPLLLHNQGYKVIVVRVGPISSDWERACEIYAQLTAGLCVIRTTALAVLGRDN